MALYIPIRNHKGKVIEITSKEVDYTIIDIIKAEAAPASTWLDLSRALLLRGDVDGYVRVLEELLTPKQRSRFSTSSKFELVQALCSLATYHLQQSRLTRNPAARNDHVSKASNFIMEAQKVDIHEQLPVILQGILAAFRVRLSNIKFLCRIC